jgi:hypothetical protein
MTVHRDVGGGRGGCGQHDPDDRAARVDGAPAVPGRPLDGNLVAGQKGVDRALQLGRSDAGQLDPPERSFDPVGQRAAACGHRLENVQPRRQRRVERGT